MFEPLTPEQRLDLARQRAAAIRRDRAESGRRLPRTTLARRPARPIGLLLVQLGFWLAGGQEARPNAAARRASGC